MQMRSLANFNRRIFDATTTAVLSTCVKINSVARITFFAQNRQSSTTRIFPLIFTNPNFLKMLRRNSIHEPSKANATWGTEVVPRRSSHSQKLQKRAKSENALLVEGGSRFGSSKNSLASDANLLSLLSSLQSPEFCGKLQPIDFDHSLKGDEWIRLPKGRNLNEKAKRYIIPTPMELYEASPERFVSCDATVSSETSFDSRKKRTFQDLSALCDDKVLGQFKFLSLHQSAVVSSSTSNGEELRKV
jgi:hypothetical protein